MLRLVWILGVWFFLGSIAQASTPPHSLSELRPISQFQDSFGDQPAKPLPDKARKAETKWMSFLLGGGLGYRSDTQEVQAGLGIGMEFWLKRVLALEISAFIFNGPLLDLRVGPALFFSNGHTGLYLGVKGSILVGAKQVLDIPTAGLTLEAGLRFDFSDSSDMLLSFDWKIMAYGNSLFLVRLSFFIF